MILAAPARINFRSDDSTAGGRRSACLDQLSRRQRREDVLRVRVDAGDHGPEPIDSGLAAGLVVGDRPSSIAAPPARDCLPDLGFVVDHDERVVCLPQIAGDLLSDAAEPQIR